MPIVYHGSPQPGLRILEPRFDARLGVSGVFVSDEPFGPMIFALLPESSLADVDYETAHGKFIRGAVSAPELNSEGWLYEMEIDEKDLLTTKTGDLYAGTPVLVKSAKLISRKDVIDLGWRIKALSGTNLLPEQ